MKRFLSLILVTMVIFSMTACGQTNTASTNNNKVEVTDELLESYAASALLEALRDGYSLKDGKKIGVEMNYAISPENCKMRIDSIDGNSSIGWVVKGEVILYDDDRDLCNVWSDGSGDYSMAFDVVITSDFSAKCTDLR